MSRRGIAQYEATVVLVVVSLALASVVYAGLKPESGLDPQPVFVNQETQVGGTPAIELVQVNASADTDITSLTLDGATSSAGILALGPEGYSASTSLCAAGEETFFSVLAPQAGTLTVSTNGQAWIAGAWGPAANVGAGWQEVMVEDGSSCSVTLPGGEAVSAQWSGSVASLSSIPAEGPRSGLGFSLYLPVGPGAHSLLITTTGGFDDVSI